MIRTILAPVSGSAVDTAVLSVAATVARAFGAYVYAVHPHFDPAAVARAAGEAHPSGIIADLVEQLGRNADAHAAKTKALAEEICARERLPLITGSAAPPSAQWRILPDEPGRLAACGMTADLIVTPRPSADEPRSRWTFNTLLFDTGRPVLVPGDAASGDIFRHLVIAWKPTPQAARALLFAMPFLARAAAVTVLTAEENEDHPVDLDSVITYLDAHGVKAEARRLSPGNGNAGAVVLEAAQQTASLLVMGAYGHSRTGEWIFGGFTRSVLNNASLPILMAH
jgi:nucleotide-binding universal stress UspA family protein